MYLSYLMSLLLNVLSKHAILQLSEADPRHPVTLPLAILTIASLVLRYYDKRMGFTTLPWSAVTMIYVACLTP